MGSLIERRVLLIGLAVCVLLGVFAWFVLYQPRVQSQRRSSAEAAEVQKELDETRERVKQTPRLRQRVADLQEANASFSARVMPRSEMLTMLRRLANIAAQYRVRFLEIAPPGLDTLLQEETGSNPLRSVPFYVTVQGRYIDVGKYIESLEKFPYFVRVPDVEVAGREDLRPEVEMKLLVNLYASSLAAGGQL